MCVSGGTELTDSVKMNLQKKSTVTVMGVCVVEIARHYVGEARAATVAKALPDTVFATSHVIHADGSAMFKGLKGLVGLPDGLQLITIHSAQF